jgi:hypothetical protein
MFLDRKLVHTMCALLFLDSYLISVIDRIVLCKILTASSMTKGSIA